MITTASHRPVLRPNRPNASARKWGKRPADQFRLAERVGAVRQVRRV